MAEADLERIAREFRAALIRQEAQAARAMARGLEAVERRVEAEVRRHLATLERAAARGAAPGITARYELGRLAALRDEVTGELDRYGARAGGVVSALQGQAAEEARGFTERFLAEVGGDRFRLAGLRPEAVQAITANLAEGSPLADLFASFGQGAGERVAEGVTAGIALGHHPHKIARTIRADVRETYRGRARMIARTEAQRAARAVSAEAYAGAGDVLQGWTWRASLDDRCCVACWAQHGTLCPLGSTLDGHPGCRCVMVPALQENLATEALPLDGESRFAQLAPERQRAILGPARFAAYQAGEVRLAHLAERVSNPRWGSHVRRSSLERARERARQGTRGAGPPEVPAGRAPRLVEEVDPATAAARARVAEAQAAADAARAAAAQAQAELAAARATLAEAERGPGRVVAEGEAMAMRERAQHARGAMFSAEHAATEAERAARAAEAALQRAIQEAASVRPIPSAAELADMPAWRRELEGIRAEAAGRWMAHGDEALTRTNARGDVVPTADALRQEELARRAGEVMAREMEERVAPALARVKDRRGEATDRYMAAQQEYMAADEAFTAANRAVSEAFEVAMRPGSGPDAAGALEAAEAAKARALERVHKAARSVNEAADAIRAADTVGPGSTRAAVWRELLAEVRDTGYGPHTPTWAAGSNKTARAVMDGVADVYPTDWWGRSAANGLAMEAKTTAGRAYYAERARTKDGRLVAQIKVPSPKAAHTGGQSRTAAHELGHRFEDVDPRLKALEWTFYARRVRGGDVDAPLPKTRGFRGRRSEPLRDAPTPFYDEYVGKDYGNTPRASFEVFSMGVDSLFRPDGGVFGRDPDHAHFTLGVLALL